ncbi:hypothetical protein TAGGR_3262 [Thermodesulfovibrio aggregans]|uniref:Flavinylation-associated cytochrome domain-containing protein n=1 Tax=Thermodesulfovibrio aggregans TaxID=86166 RepID=A0A0U9HV19_9BACT|nr:DUF4405 domain-containing protein [Thermodesulfovibrio aggregans]GAQ95786.1 hypothetical protein TAGGR_3262 [Thermodesulfovibrio aggregans]
MKKFNFRGFVSLFTAFSFLFVFISGIVLYFTPQGRIAYWINWKFLGLTKTDWTNMHIVFCIFFMTAAFFHIYYNWNVLLNYIYSKVKKAFNLKKELAIVSIIVILSFIGSLKPFPPFSFIIDLSEYLKQSWVKSPDYEPPFGHAELLSLEEFSKRRNIDLEQAVLALKQRDIKFQSTKESLGLIAKKNGLSPLEIYEILKPLEGKQNQIDRKSDYQTEQKIVHQTESSRWTKDEIIREFEGKGLGKKTLKQICEENRLDIKTAIHKLKNKGIEAREGETLRQIADRNNTSPIEVLIEILVNENKVKG